MDRPRDEVLTEAAACLQGSGFKTRKSKKQLKPRSDIFSLGPFARVCCRMCTPFSAPWRQRRAGSCDVSYCCLFGDDPLPVMSVSHVSVPAWVRCERRLPWQVCGCLQVASGPGYVLRGFLGMLWDFFSEHEIDNQAQDLSVKREWGRENLERSPGRGCVSQTESMGASHSNVGRIKMYL